MPIDPLAPAPLVTDTADAFNSKAFARVLSEDTFVVQANALEANVNAQEALAAGYAAAAATSAIEAANASGAALFNAATNYSIGAVAISAVNFMTYRNTLGGVNATDPANDTTGRWVNIGNPPVTVVDVSSNFTFMPGVLYRMTAACTGTFPATPHRGEVFSFRVVGNYACALDPNGHKIEGVSDTSFPIDSPMQNIVWSLMYSGSTKGMEFVS